MEDRQLVAINGERPWDFPTTIRLLAVPHPVRRVTTRTFGELTR